MAKLSKQDKDMQSKKIRKYALMSAIFFGLIVSNITNYLWLLWISDSGIIFRQMINYFLWPIFFIFISDDIFERLNYDELKIKSIFRNHILIWIFVFFAWIACVINITYENEKIICFQTEQTKENIGNCLKETNKLKNILNISKII